MSIGHNRRRSLVTPPSLTPQRDVSDFVEAFKSRHLSSGSAPSTPTSRRRGSLPCAIPRKTMSWSQNLENLIEDPAGKLAFAAFLQDEFASENLNFLLAAKRFSQQVNFIEQKKSAEDVILRFIGDKSETPVNLSAEIETGIFRSFERGEIKSSLFDAAQDAIRN